MLAANVDAKTRKIRVHYTVVLLTYGVILQSTTTTILAMCMRDEAINLTLGNLHYSYNLRPGI